MNTTPIEEIAEHDASGRVAEIYGDIRATLSLPLVNLIWRHLAVEPAALEWAWTAARPLYADGTAAAESRALLDGLKLPVAAPIPPAVSGLAGVTSADRRALRQVLDAYNRGNSLNLVALAALVTDPEPESGASAALRGAGGASEASNGGDSIPAIPPIASLCANALAVVHRLNTFGTDGGASPVIASLYRHLALWPGALALTWTALAPLQESGALRAAIVSVRTAGASSAARAAHARGPTPDGAAGTRAKTAIATFVDAAITRMIPVGLILRRAFD